MKKSTLSIPKLLSASSASSAVKSEIPRSPFADFLNDLQLLIDRHRPAADLVDQAHAMAARREEIALAYEPGLRNTFATIVEYIANDRQVAPGLLDGSIRHSREQRVCELRWLCFLFCSEFSDVPEGVVAEYFHKKRGSVRHGLDRLHALASIEPHTQALISRLRAELTIVLSTANENRRRRGDEALIKNP
jgi:hypothetical protein